MGSCPRLLDKKLWRTRRVEAANRLPRYTGSAPWPRRLAWQPSVRTGCFGHGETRGAGLSSWRDGFQAVPPFDGAGHKGRAGLSRFRGSYPHCQGGFVSVPKSSKRQQAGVLPTLGEFGGGGWGCGRAWSAAATRRWGSFHRGSGAAGQGRPMVQRLSVASLTVIQAMALSFRTGAGVDRFGRFSFACGNEGWFRWLRRPASLKH